MKLSEVFLGEVRIPWTYSIVKYEADCTEGLELDLFDRAVCGVLNLDGAVTAERLGEILGLNVVSDIDNGRYADNAEQELLSNVITSLVEFHMIERDEMNNLLLTPLGREYFQKGKKFRTTHSQEFLVYYDITGGNHAQAKKAREYIKGIPRPGQSRPEYRDEVSLKTFLHEQLPEIYDLEKGNSFTNLKLRDIREIQSLVSFAVIYDMQERTYRFIGFASEDESIKESAFFTESANSSEKLRGRIVSLFTERCPKVDTPADAEIEEFEQLASEAQGMYDFNKYNNEDPTEIADSFKANRKVFEQERFWSDVTSFISEDTREIYFNFGMLDMTMLARLDTLSKARPDMSMFVLYRETDQEINDHFGKVFFFNAHGTASGVFCCTEKVVFKYINYLLPGDDAVRPAVPIIFKDEETSVDTSRFKQNFASIFARKLYQEAMDYLDNEFKGSKMDVSNVSLCDSSMEVFRDFYSEGELRALSEKKLLVFNKVKKLYETSLIEKLGKIEEDADIENIGKLDVIGIYRDRINEVLSEVDESYINLHDIAKALKARLTEREQYIREELLAKTYIIDTNSLIKDPDIVNKFNRKDRIVIPLATYEELEKLKAKYAGTPDGENARIARKNIDVLQKKNKKRVRVEKGKLSLLPGELQNINSRNPDNYILAVAIAHMKENPYLITYDAGLKTKAEVEDITVITVEEFAERRETKNQPLSNIIA